MNVLSRHVPKQGSVLSASTLSRVGEDSFRAGVVQADAEASRRAEGADEEALIVDVRAGLTPAELVERKLVRLLRAPVAK